MKRLTEWLAGLTRVIGGLLAFLLLLAGLWAAAKGLRERLRNMRQEE